MRHGTRTPVTLTVACTEKSEMEEEKGNVHLVVAQESWRELEVGYIQYIAHLLAFSMQPCYYYFLSHFCCWCQVMFGLKTLMSVLEPVQRNSSVFWSTMVILHLGHNSYGG